MMDLYLHVGTEKTGSSFLQSLLAINREQLESASIQFPKAGKREKDMRSGKISPGNGQDLYEALSEKNDDSVKEILLGHFLTAKKKGLEINLISNEMLVSAFAKEGVVNSFVQIAKSIGYNKIKLLLILRDPVEQALSLYKHRAKSGDVAPIGEWIKNSYTYGDVLGSLFNILNNVDMIDIEYRMYSSRTGFLETVLFQDWLQIGKPDKTLDKNVNPSLTLSELLMLRNMNLQIPELVPLLYDKFLKIPKSSKAGEPRLERYYRNIISKNLQGFNEVWKQCNERLGHGEYIKIPRTVDESQGTDIDQDNVMTFTDAQIAVINSFIRSSLSYNMNLELFKRKLLRRLSKLKSKITGIIGLKS